MSMFDNKRAVVMALVVTLALIGFASGAASAGQADSDACIPAYGDVGTYGSADDGVSTSGCINDGGGSGCYYGC